MAFTIDYMQKVNSGANDDSNRVFVYNGTSSGSNETLATLAGSGYFNSYQQKLASGFEFGPIRVGDIIFLNGNDASGIYQFDSITTNVTVAAYTSSAATASHVVKYADQVTSTGGAASEDFTVTGALTSDLAFVQLEDDGTSNVTVLYAAIDSADTLTVVFSANPGNDAVINYQVLRAV